MNLDITLEKMARAAACNISGKDKTFNVKNIVTDSRKIKKNSIFWALKGEKFDGSDYAEEAFARGAKAVVMDMNKPKPAAFNREKQVLLMSADTLVSLQKLAAWHREQFELKITAVTGSNGKSSVKQMLSAICAAAGKTVSTQGNLNNQIGLPLSLLEITGEDKYGVFELGASKKGDIEEIAVPAAPDVAVITNISPAHMQGFKTLKNVFETKTEILKGLRESGALVYNNDDEMLAKLQHSFKGKAVTFGFNAGADVQIMESENFVFNYKEKEYSFDIKLERHNKLNAAAACAAAFALGLDKKHMEKGLLSFKPMPMRLERKVKNGVTFLLDAYNANPASMEVALRALSSESGPRTAVLGDMKELGEVSEKYHKELADVIEASKTDNVFLAGPEMKAAYKALADKKLSINVKYAVDPKEWKQELKNTLKHGGACLIKASRSMAFEKIFEEI